MSLGQLTRKIFGKQFNRVGRIYRKFFFNIDEFVNTLPKLQSGEMILDIGGGDGEVINSLLNADQSLSAVMIDVSNHIGGMIDEANKSRVRVLAGFSVDDYTKSSLYEETKYLLVSDVLHHIVKAERESFLDDLSLLCIEKTVLIVKDIEPGYVKSWLSLLSDRYVSGDYSTSLISRRELIKLMKQKYPKIWVEETPLLNTDPPNYCLIFSNFK